MDDLFATIHAAYHRLLRRWGGHLNIPRAAFRGLNDCMDGVGLDEPGWA